MHHPLSLPTDPNVNNETLIKCKLVQKLWRKVMPGLKVKLNNVERPFNVNMVDAGTYDVTLTGTKLRKTKAQDDMMNFEWTIKNAENPDVNGKKVFTNYMMTEKGFPYFKEALITLGVDDSVVDDEDGFDVEEVCGELHGTEAIAIVSVVPDNRDPSGEKLQNRVRIQSTDEGY